MEVSTGRESKRTELGTETAGTDILHNRSVMQPAVEFGR